MDNTNDNEDSKQPALNEGEGGPKEQNQQEPARPAARSQGQQRDADSKRRAAGRSITPATVPGAVASRDPAPTKRRTTATACDASASSTGTASERAEASRLAVERNMQERDILAKRRAVARGGPATTPGVVSAISAGTTSINRPAPGDPRIWSETAAPVEALPAALACRVPSSAYARQQQEQGFEAENSSEAVTGPAASSSAASVAVASSTYASALPYNAAAVGAMDGDDDDDQFDVDKANEEVQNKEDAAEEAVAEAAPAVVEAAPPEVQEVASVPEYPGLNSDALPGDILDPGIEAFVADTVVDATGVAVVMSEEEEEKFEQNRRKKYLCYGAIVLVIVAISIVVPVVLLVGGGKTVVVPVAPSIAPSMMPSAIPSSAPTTDVFSTFLRILEDLPVTAEGIFDDRNAPQYLAALWLADKDDFFANSGLAIEAPKVLQRYALASLYYSANGDSWKLCGQASPSCGETMWLTETDECDWFAVSCEAGVVTHINFPATGNDLVGTMPAELSLLTGLKRFLAPENSLRGDLDVAFGELSTLQTVAMPDNRLTGTVPTGIMQKNPNLGFVDLGGNQFEGTLPSSVAVASKLSDLQLNANLLTGTIPAEIGQLAELINFEVQSNSLQGSIPDELFSLTKLQTFSVRENKEINGTINPLVSQLTDLKILQVGFTGMGGPIPPQMFALTDLAEMNLEGAQFSGTIPEDFKLLNASLMDLYLNDNQFTGPVPLAFDALTALETLQIQGNQLTGSISAVVCSERGLRFQQLATLIVDCVVTCDCCDNCEGEPLK